VIERRAAARAAATEERFVPHTMHNDLELLRLIDEER